MKKLMYVMIALLAITAVSATCSEETTNEMRSCIGRVFIGTQPTMCNNYDLNHDGRIDLSDVSLLAQKCASEPEQEVITPSRGGSFGFNDMKEYLFGEFITYLKTIFATHEDVAKAQAQVIYGFETQENIIDCKVSIIMANQQNSSYRYNGWVASPDATSCTKIIGV